MKTMRMDARRRRRLEAGGWKVGTVRELLGLSAAEEAYIEIKINLMRSLRIRRQKLGWTQAQVARRLRSSQSRVAKMEAGDPQVSIDLMMSALLELGATRRDLARIISSRAA